MLVDYWFAEPFRQSPVLLVVLVARAGPAEFCNWHPFDNFTLVIIPYIILNKFVIKTTFKRLGKPYKSMRSLMLDINPYVILNKFLIKKTFKD